MVLRAENNPFPSVLLEEVASDGSDTDTPAADFRRVFLGEDGALHLKDSAAAVTDIVGASAHIADTSDAHDASAISFSSSGSIAATDVQAAIEEVASEAAGGGTASSCRAINNGTQNVASGTAFVEVGFDTDIHDDADYHCTSSANLTGTVAKTNGSATLTGTGTNFTGELVVGQVIDVPGTATERRVVIAIASATSLTVNSNFANTASGQTATRVNSQFVAVTAGTYLFGGFVKHEANASGTQRVNTLLLNGSEISGTESTAAPSAGHDVAFATQRCVRKLSQWDRVSLGVYQDSGGTRTIGAATGGKSCSFDFVRLGN